MRWSLGAGVAVALAAGGAPAYADVSVNLEEVASGLTAPMMMVQPAGDDRRFIVQQNGLVRILAQGRRAPGRAVPRSHRPDHPAVAAVRREGPARPRVPPGLRQQRQVLRRLQPTDPLAGRSRQALLVVAHQRDRGVHGLQGRSRRGGRDHGAPDLGDRLAAVQSQRPLDRLRPGRHAVHLDRRRRLRQRLGHRPQRDRGQRPGPARSPHGKILRIDVNGTSERPELRHPGRQSIRRPGWHRAARDLGLRPAQPVALLVRHGRRPPAVLRRRAAEQLRGGRASSRRAATTAGA